MCVAASRLYVVPAHWGMMLWSVIWCVMMTSTAELCLDVCLTVVHWCWHPYWHRVQHVKQWPLLHIVNATVQARSPIWLQRVMEDEHHSQSLVTVGQLPVGQAPATCWSGARLSQSHIDIDVYVCLFVAWLLLQNMFGKANFEELSADERQRWVVRWCA